MPERMAVVIPTYKEARLSETVDVLSQQTRPIDDIVIVNNCPSDTLEISDALLPCGSTLHVIDEPRKGTGTASNTGFEYAISTLGANIIRRTDADTLPSKSWVEVIYEYFAMHPNKQLVTGPNPPIHDEHFRAADAVLWPAFWKTFKTAVSVASLCPVYMRTAPGHNLAIRSAAFEAVGRFTDSSIDDTDEDIELSRQIYDTFGFKAMGYSRQMEVNTSLRRLRKVGYMGLVGYYLHPNQQDRLLKTGGNIDIR